jgi:hypothetical protein
VHVEIPAGQHNPLATRLPHGHSPGPVDHTSCPSIVVPGGRFRTDSRARVDIVVGVRWLARERFPCLALSACERLELDLMRARSQWVETQVDSLSSRFTIFVTCALSCRLRVTDGLLERMPLRRMVLEGGFWTL